MTDARWNGHLPDWPLADLQLRLGDVRLRTVREQDLAHLATIQPEDYEHDPRAEALPGLTLEQHRRRLVYQGYWRSLGSWSPSSWCLDFLVERQGIVAGVQSLEADDFLMLRTVHSGSWLVRSARGQGLGVAMRAAVLGLAFDHLGALAAISSARRDNGASLGVSKHLGYSDNGMSYNASASGIVELQHMRIGADDWRASRRHGHVEVSGLKPCLPWFGL